jgi:hypothetical protein
MPHLPKKTASVLALGIIGGLGLLALWGCGFSQVDYTLTVVIVGPGTGTVSSIPSGISCPESCTGSFKSGSSVTLNPAPSLGSIFSGWSMGVCTGTSACSLPLTANQTVTASFGLGAQSKTEILP